MASVLFTKLMDIRKVHRVGRSSLSVTLPYKWARRNALQAGDAIHVQEIDDNTLVISSNDVGSGSGDLRTFEVGSDTSPDHLRRLLIGTYVTGANHVRISAKKGELRPAQLEALNGCVSRLTGFLVIEQTDDLFVIQNFMDPSASLFSDHLNQLLSITQRMIRLSPQILSDEGGQFSQKMITLGDQSDRLYYLTVRFLLLSLSDRALLLDMGFDSTQEVVGGRLIAKGLEEICDRMEYLADLALQNDDTDWSFKKKQLKRAESQIERICELLGASVEGYFSGAVDLPEAALDELYSVQREADAMIPKTGDTPGNITAIQAVAFSSISEAGRLTRMISEVAMNNSLRRMRSNGENGK